jgi:hypothetical protein
MLCIASPESPPNTYYTITIIHEGNKTFFDSICCRFALLCSIVLARITKFSRVLSFPCVEKEAYSDIINNSVTI